jgi:ABC-type amino acid transport system permease subunit
MRTQKKKWLAYLATGRVEVNRNVPITSIPVIQFLGIGLAIRGEVD